MDLQEQLHRDSTNRKICVYCLPLASPVKSLLSSDPEDLLRHSPLLSPRSWIWSYCDAQCFKVATKGQHRFDCTYGVPSLQQVDTLQVGGDVTLTQALV